MAFPLRWLAVALTLASVMTPIGCGRRYSGTSDKCNGEACPESDGDNPGGTPLATSCISSADCSNGDLCLSGTCKAAPTTSTQCSQQNDCTAGMYCHLARQVCVACLNDDACALGSVCRSDGTCGSADSACNSASCGEMVCDNDSGRCVQCLADTDCPTGQTCRNKACSGSVACTSQNDCLSLGRICDTTTGQCAPCAQDAQCGSGKVCAAGVCTTPGGGGGGGGGGNGTCSTIDDCGGQACFIGLCMPCFMDEMCLDINSLMSGEVKICDPQSGTCMEPECESAYDCASHQACYGNGHCGQCQENSECRDGERCTRSTGECR